MNQGGQPLNRQRDRIGKTRSLLVRKRDRGDPVRLAVNVTGSMMADRGITAQRYDTASINVGSINYEHVWYIAEMEGIVSCNSYTAVDTASLSAL